MRPEHHAGSHPIRIVFLRPRAPKTCCPSRGCFLNLNLPFIIQTGLSGSVMRNCLEGVLEWHSLNALLNVWRRDRQSKPDLRFSKPGLIPFELSRRWGHGRCSRPRPRFPEKPFFIRLSLTCELLTSIRNFSSSISDRCTPLCTSILSAYPGVSECPCEQNCSLEISRQAPETESRAAYRK